MRACVHVGVCNVHVWVFRILYELSYEPESDLCSYCLFSSQVTFNSLLCKPKNHFTLF